MNNAIKGRHWKTCCRVKQNKEIKESSKIGHRNSTIFRISGPRDGFFSGRGGGVKMVCATPG